MKWYARFASLMAIAVPAVTLVHADTPSTQPTSPLQFTMDDIHGKSTDLSQYMGKVVLIVNTASKCGFTKQYAGLEKLNETYKDRGLVVLGFPCNDFHQQDPGTNAEIEQFCKLTYSVAFPMFSKVTVKGDDKTPLYAWLISKETDPQFGGEIKWNFTKFLVDRQGKVVARFEPKDAPDTPEFITAVETQLNKN